MNNIENIYTGYDDIVAEFTEAGIKDTITILLKELEEGERCLKCLL